MTQRLTWLFAATTGVAVANLYYVQPLLALIGRDLHTTASATGLLVTATQVGYVLGILLIVPLGDTRARHRLIPTVMTLSAGALALSAAAPSFPALTVGLLLVGLTTVSGQIIIAFAGDLADDGQRGRVVGTVVSGLLVGILGARIVGGLIAELAGWRVTFAAAAALTLATAGAQWRYAPQAPRRSASVPYRALLRSVVTIAARTRGLGSIMLLGALTMFVFTLFWTSITFLLSEAPFRYGSFAIGLFGLAGLAVAAAAQGGGRLHDHGHDLAGTIVAWLVVLAAFGVFALGGRSLVLLLVGTVLFDLAIQTQRILNQSQAFALAPNSRSRVNTAYIAGNFMGAACGSLLATALWAIDRWPAVTIAGACTALVALAICTTRAFTVAASGGRKTHPTFVASACSGVGARAPRSSGTRDDIAGHLAADSRVSKDPQR
jgi:predicted MFS family arabinose efflux permease